MRVIFMGTPDLAAHVLEQLLEGGHEIVGVVTQQDKPQGRHAKLVPSPVKQFALKHWPAEIVWQPLRAREPLFIEQLQLLKPDVIVVAAYGQILPQQILDIPRLGCINVHYSLLPKLRGAAPIQRAIAEGYALTGVTIMRMVQQMDAGAILAQEAIGIDQTTTSGSLREQLTRLSGPLLLDVLRRLQEGSCIDSEQNPAEVTMAPKINSMQAQIDWCLDAAALQRLIRAMDPEPGAWCWVELRGERKRLQCFDPLVESQVSEAAPGTLVAMGHKLLIATGRGVLSLGRVKPEGRGMMSAKAFSSGYQLDAIFFEKPFPFQLN